MTCKQKGKKVERQVTALPLRQHFEKQKLCIIVSQKHNKI